MNENPNFAVLSDLWETFHRTHGPAVFILATRRYAGPKFPKERFHTAPDEFGSPMDLIEREFISTLRPFDIHFLRDGQSIAAMGSRDPGGDRDIFARMSVVESTSEVEQQQSETVDWTSWYWWMGGRHFRKWPHQSGDARHWGETYTELQTEEEARKLLRKTPYHRLPIFYERHTFCVPQDVPPWFPGLLEEENYTRLHARLYGSAMALTASDAVRWRRSVIPGGHLKARWREDGIEKATKGRPRKKEQALNYFDRLYPNGKGNQTWDSIVAEIARTFGFTFTKKLLSDAVNKREKERK